MAVELQRRTFTVEEYYRMAEAGILGEDDRVELLEGEIVVMSPIGPPHAFSVCQLSRLLLAGVGDRAVVRVQNPVRFGERSEPEPDLALLRPPPDRYRQAHPGPEDVLLIIEVADTSVETDRARKLPLYARSRIPEAWLVNLQADGVEVHRQPGPAGYAVRERVSRGGHLSPSAFPGVTLSVDEILP